MAKQDGAVPQTDEIGPPHGEDTAGDTDAPAVNLLVTQERIEVLKVGVFKRGTREGDFEGKIDLIAHFVTGPKGYLSFENAVESLDDITMGQLNEVAEELGRQMSEEVAPKV